jgi:molybdenum cofactor guanylyltransferase
VSSTERGPLAGVVLCGGRSSRMGTDKALIAIDGVPLFRRVAERLAHAAWPVFVAPGTTGRLGEVGYPNLSDAVADSGPLGGIVSALRASPHPLVAVVGVDMPFASGDVLRLLADLIGDADAAVPVTEEGPQPLHAVFARSALPTLERALVDGQRSVQGALQQLTVRDVGPGEWRAADPSGRFAFNLNRPEDIAKIRSWVDREAAS